MMGNEVKFMEQLESIRKQTMAISNYDLFSGGEFIELLVCKLCNLEQTPHNGMYDGLGTNGERVEVKHSNITYSNKYKRCGFFAWHKIKSRNADVFVLVGNDFKNLKFFVIPACYIGHEHIITYMIDPPPKKGNHLWHQYLVDIDNLKSEVEIAFEINNHNLLNLTNARQKNE